MVDCLIDFIGLRNCSTVEPESGLYINSLPGISLKQLQRISNSEQLNYAGVWHDVQIRAALRLESKFTSLLNHYYRVNCCNPDCSIPDIICNYRSQLVEPYWYLLGAEIMTEQIYSERINFFTTIEEKPARELLDYFQSEYEKLLESAVKNIPEELIKDCYVCTGGQVSYQIDIP